MKDLQDLLECIRQCREEFIFYYDRGEKEARWKRGFSMYIMWVFLYDHDDMRLRAFAVWERATRIIPCREYEPGAYDRFISQFDLMEKIAKLWVFS